MTFAEKIRTSFTTQLSLWVAGFVVTISGMVLYLLASFSESVIRDETIDATLQALENTALRIDNTLRQAEMRNRLEHNRFRMNRSRVEQLIEESGSETKLQQSLPNVQLYVTRRDSSQFDTFITGGDVGCRRLMYDDKEIYIFSQPLGDRPYCLAAVCPANDIYRRYGRMQWLLLSCSVIALAVLLYVLYTVIGHHLLPLHRLADSAQAISRGDLDTPIDATSHIDETGRLQNSFSMMQRKLAAYMVEMQQKQDTLNRQQVDLQTAYDEAKAYEERKAQFLRSLTRRMALPVEKLCQRTDNICRDYSSLSRDDMTAIQTGIMNDSKTITQLLDQLIKDPTGS